MGNLLRIDGPVMEFLGKITDIMIVNVLTLLCCIPVITIGASYTAMYSVLLKIYRNQTSNVVKDFFHAFRKNFGIGTAIWIIYFIILVLLGWDLYLIYASVVIVGDVLKYLLYAVVFLVLISTTWVFVLLSRYENSVGQTIKNSFFVGIRFLLRSIVMLSLTLLPWVILLVFPGAFPVVLLLGVAATGYFQTMLFQKIFIKLESSSHEENPG
jgi:uncharacterized membrane protein YesL